MDKIVGRISNTEEFSLRMYWLMFIILRYSKYYSENNFSFVCQVAAETHISYQLKYSEIFINSIK